CPEQGAGAGLLQLHVCRLSGVARPGRRGWRQGRQAEGEVVAAVMLDRVADLSDAGRAAVRSLSLAVYPPEEWADWPGRHVEWSEPQWCVRVQGEDDQLLCYVGVYLREAE